MNKYIVLLLVLITASCMIQCTSEEVAPPINWRDWASWDTLRMKGDKPAIVWIHTETCEPCLNMEAEVFGHPYIAKYINEHFYAGDLPNSYQKSITTQGHTFHYVTRHNTIGYHDLAHQLTDANRFKFQMPLYPSIAFLDKDFSLIFSVVKPITAEEMEWLLAYVHEGAYKNMNTATFKAGFQSQLKSPS